MTVYVWGILAGSAVGLLASTLGRLYASTYYALHDTRRRSASRWFACALTIGLGYLFALPLPRQLGIDPRWGAAGLTASAGIAGWVEFACCAAPLNRRIGADRHCRWPLAHAALGRRGRGGGGAAWVLRLALRRADRSSPPCCS